MCVCVSLWYISNPCKKVCFRLWWQNPKSKTVSWQLHSLLSWNSWGQSGNNVKCWKIIGESKNGDGVKEGKAKYIPSGKKKKKKSEIGKANWTTEDGEKFTFFLQFKRIRMLNFSGTTEKVSWISEQLEQESRIQGNVRNF